MLSAGPVCSCAHFFVHIAHETAGAARTRSSLRPRYFEGHEPSHHLGRASPASVEVRLDAFSTSPRDGQGEGDDAPAMVAGQAGLSCTFGS